MGDENRKKIPPKKIGANSNVRADFLFQIRVTS
jgi:hypothetical protein